MNGKESRSTEYIRGWPSIDDTNTDTIRAKVSLLPLWGRKKKIVETSEKCREKKKKGKMEKRREGNIRNSVIFSEENFQREIKGKRRLINRGRGFNYCLQKWFGRRIVESFIDDGSPATGFFPRNRGLAESLDCCQLKGTLFLSVSLSLSTPRDILTKIIFEKLLSFVRSKQNHRYYSFYSLLLVAQNCNVNESNGIMHDALLLVIEA